MNGEKRDRQEKEAETLRVADSDTWQSVRVMIQKAAEFWKTA